MSKMIDITNQKFGKLTALYPIKKSNPLKWHCKCDCGNEVDVRSIYLRNGHTTSCGCLKKEKCQKMGKNNIHNLIGERFGYLTVIDMSKNKTGTNYKWICKCDCGNEVEVAGADLVCGKIKSCGCQRYNKNYLIENMIGKQFGKLTVLECVGQAPDKSFNYLCKCDCGNTKVVNGVSLRKKTTVSCGCINYSIGEKKIKEILDNNKFLYIKEYNVKIGDNNYRYDFALLNKENNNIIRLIEFDGRQHFEPYSNKNWENNCPLIERQKRDQIKNQYALNNNIPLVRIPYTERDNITLDIIIGDKYLVKEKLDSPRYSVIK